MNMVNDTYYPYLRMRCRLALSANLRCHHGHNMAWRMTSVSTVRCSPLLSVCVVRCSSTMSPKDDDIMNVNIGVISCFLHEEEVYDYACLMTV
jgi:hypothetical protein